MPADLAQLYDQHAAALYALALNVARSEADARDVVQEVFVKIARRPALLDGVREERAFLLRVTHRQTLDALRRRASHAAAIERAAAEPVELFAAEDEDAEFRAAVAAALGELPAEQRAVVHLKIWENLTFAQIADALEIPANTAASRYRYALDKLGALLRPNYENTQP